MTLERVLTLSRRMARWHCWVVIMHRRSDQMLCLHLCNTWIGSVGCSRKAA